MTGLRRSGIYILNGILLWHRKEWNNAIWNNMDGPTKWLTYLVSYHTKWTKKEEDNIVWCHLYGESKNWYRWTYLQTDTDSQIFKTNLWLPRGKTRRGEELGVWD